MARKEIDEYIKKCDNIDLNITLNLIIDNLVDNYSDDYAKYYLFRLLIDMDTLPYYMPCNSSMIIEARKVLNYFAEINHKKIITGQHTQTVGQEELAHIKKITGYYPKIVGYELLALSQNINPESDKECLEEVEDNKGTMQVAMYDKSKSILTFTWHMFSPLYGCGKSFYAKNTTFDVRKILCGDETEEYTAFMNELDHMAKVLKHFKEMKKPILFRPFHEADGDWFWWGKYGVEYAKDLYIMMYNYFVEEKGLNNLIWVWNSIGAYPGDEYVDIISVDCYGEEKDSKTCYIDKYNELLEKVSKDKLVALAECDVIPDIEELKENHFPFIYYMTWSKEFALTEKYN
jgi:mannan endo-1,4-beta-mannosidase